MTIHTETDKTHINVYKNLKSYNIFIKEKEEEEEKNQSLNNRNITSFKIYIYIYNKIKI